MAALWALFGVILIHKRAQHVKTVNSNPRFGRPMRQQDSWVFVALGCVCLVVAAVLLVVGIVGGA